MFFILLFIYESRKKDLFFPYCAKKSKIFSSFPKIFQSSFALSINLLYFISMKSKCYSFSRIHPPSLLYYTTIPAMSFGLHIKFEAFPIYNPFSFLNAPSNFAIFFHFISDINSNILSSISPLILSNASSNNILFFWWNHKITLFPYISYVDSISPHRVTLMYWQPHFCSNKILLYCKKKILKNK